MEKEKIFPKRSTLLRKNTTEELLINIHPKDYQNLFLINGNRFIMKGILESDLVINPNSFYMVINNKNHEILITYNQNVSHHKVVYDPYKYETSEKISLKEDMFKNRYNIPIGFIDTLPKWYSFKFTYSNYNLIFLRPEFGLSIQSHKYRKEYWEILEGKPIIICGINVYYYVENGKSFETPINTFHSVINPNKNKDEFVLIKERWDGKFYESDIERIFNPNNYK